MVVLTQLPLKSVLRTADYTGMIAIWSIILGAFDIKYMPRTSIKGQVLADLIAEFAEPPVEIVVEEQNMDGKSVGVISTPGPPCWKVYVDGAANQRGSGVGLVLISLEEAIIEKSLRLGFSATNNEAEYEALLQGIAMVQKMEGKAVEMFSDSRLVVGQVKGELEARDARVLKPGQMLTAGLRLFHLVAHPQEWKHSCKFTSHACHLLGRGSAPNYSRQASGQSERSSQRHGPCS